MYILFGFFIAVCILFFIINFWRRKRIICKIRCMDFCEKLCLLNNLAEPFGFSYLPVQDVITTETDAWQKNFGYRYLYDQSASRFNMVFDCEPFYFDYNGRTWLIEFWKGQYGINVGGEVGIYYSDTIVPPEEYRQTLFHGVSDDDMLFISMTMTYNGSPLFFVCRDHWWLTGFCTGIFCNPEDLEMDVSITFPCRNMLERFVESLLNAGYEQNEICICGLTVSLSFSVPHAQQPRFSHRLWTHISQFQNRIFCKLYNAVSRPFTRTMDRILYLYFFLPFSVRRLFLFRKNRRQKFNRKQLSRKRKENI